MMEDVLRGVSEALAASVEATSPGVVRVAARRRLAATGIVWSSDGVIVTAHHVVEQDDAIGVGLPNGQTTTATLVGRDPTTDLAVLRTEVTDLTPPVWAESDGHSWRVGQMVLALGRPAQSVQATLGIVSAVGEDWRTPAGGLIDFYLQTDVVMYPGFSGGPLVDASGHVVGLNTSALLRHVSLTVPVSTLRRVVSMLLTDGRVRRGFLGVSTQQVRLPESLAQQLDQETGLLLIAVEPDSPAEQGGFLLGDTLVSLDGTAVCQHDDLLALTGPERIGTTVSIRMIRSGQLQEQQVTIGERT
ncbi:MAG: trypsin-like peptidase domain-containing protein [bacterium]|nr:trypsin-like peptidase domain-containing protein [bacterium]